MKWTIVAACLLGTSILAVPIAYQSVQSEKYRNFRVVKPGVLYRSGQLSESGFEQKANEYGFRTVVSLREFRDKEGVLQPDHTEIKYCKEHGIKHVILKPMQWHQDASGYAEVETNLRFFLELMHDESNHPVLVHCFAGIHRTGGYVAAYRLHFEDWTAAEAIAEMITMGTVRTKFDPDTSALLHRLEKRRLLK